MMTMLYRIAAASLILFACLSAAIYWQGLDSLHVIYVNHAKLKQDMPVDLDAHDPTDPKACYSLLIGSHEIETGASVVIASYELNNGSFWVVDDETFEFITIEIPALLVNQVVEIPNENVAIRYSSGGQFQKLRCGGSFGVATAGSIATVARSHLALDVSVDLVLSVHDAKAADKVSVRRLRKEFTARLRSDTGGPASFSPGIFAPYL